MFNRAVDSFIKELERNNPNIEKEEIKKILLVFKDKKNIYEMIEKSYNIDNLFKYIKESPGFTFNFTTDNINIHLYGGNKDLKGNKINENTLFDMASITKMYTMLIIYKLFEQNIIKKTTKVKELVKYPNIEDMTIEELITFRAKFQTNKRINEAKTRLEALEILHNTNGVKSEYNYNDISSMILKEIAEKVTNLSYEELLKKLILKKISCQDTFSKVPDSHKDNITGTPNIEQRLCNDASAAILGGCYGHAGIFTTTKDLTKMMRDFINGQIVDPSDFYTPGTDKGHAIVGNIWIKESHYIDNKFPIKSICVQGSTRVQANASIFELDKKYTLSSNVLLNPTVITTEEAIKKAESNKRIYKEFNGFKQIDARYIMPIAETMIPLNKEVSNIMIRLLYIEYIMSKYEKNKEFKKEITKVLVR